MSFAKRLALFLLLPMLPFLLFLTALNVAVMGVAGEPEPVKEILRESGLYDSAVNTFLESTDNPNNDTSSEIATDNPVVQDAFKKAFSPQLIQASTENFIDSLYEWMKGETEVPDFRIDLTQAKATFIDEVAAGAQARAAGLPACPRGQTSFEDPFSATCLPRGASPALAAEKIQSELGGSEDFLKDPVLTASSFKSEGGQQGSVFANSPLPDVYQNMKNARIVLIVLALLVGAGIILLSPTLRAGIRRVGIVLVVVGLGILISVFISNKAVTGMLPELVAKSENPALAEKLQSVIKDIVQNSNKSFSMFGWAYTVLGVAAIAGSIFINRQKTSVVAASSQKSSPKLNGADNSPPKKTK